MSRVLPRLGLGIVLVAAAASAWAHGGGSTGYASTTVSRRTVRYSLTLPTAVLPSELAEAFRLAGAGRAASREELLGLPTHGLALALFGFNLGVELGQGTVVALALPLLALIRRTGWEGRMVWSSSLAILVVGVVLFVERAFF